MAEQGAAQERTPVYRQLWFWVLIAIAGGILFVYVMLQAIVRGRRTGA